MFTALYGLSPYITPLRFVLKGLIFTTKITGNFSRLFAWYKNFPGLSKPVIAKHFLEVCSGFGDLQMAAVQYKVPGN